MCFFTLTLLLKHNPTGHYVVYVLQGDRFLDGDTQYSTEYESGTESREAVNDRIEPYPGDLSKVSMCVCLEVL